ncbi:alkaline phosphatase family protein [Humibacter ginsenosidimutans]|uniref:Phosphodiesterase n=1 Tax=Humibacter ginsenosidimutans TaxID=2599293 RepID=A0A5B8M1P2_9MICO|nr:alkaline phosphatase family protein [Humibacter ginsenosidimutans]QDZ13610.1 phosphodiesterase [Humibacter ginsenosidimutans]
MSQSHLSSHVLVVAWDGVRDDEVRAASTPWLDSIATDGFFATVPVHPANPTISGPVWSTVATGTYSDLHGVRDNDLHSHRFECYPDFLTRIRTVLPEATTFAAASWGQLVTEAGGGPVFRAGGYRPELAPGAEDGDLSIVAVMDDAVISRTARELLLRDHAAVFSYVVLPDTVGHHEGVTARYRSAIETCDEQLGVLLAAIEARPHRSDEEWTVIVVTDHGHLDAGHHGGDSVEERNAWIAAAGPGIHAEHGAGVDHADIAPHVLHALGIPVPADADFEGAPFGHRDDAPATASTPA